MVIGGKGMITVKRILVILISISAILFLSFTAGCSNEGNMIEKPEMLSNQIAQISKDEKKLIVYASIYPMYDFAKNIGGDKIELKQMIPVGAEPHAWEPTAKLMAAMEKADVFIYNGAGMEPWAEKLVKSLKNEKLIVVDASEGIELLEFEHGEEHDGERDHIHGRYDPHIWLDPMNAIKQAESIKNALVKGDGANKEFYEKNYKDFANRLKTLDERYKYELGRLKKKEIVVSHEAFGYLAKRYGLLQIAVKGITPEEEPSPAKMAEITEILKSRDIKYIFIEALTSSRLSEALAKEVGAKTAILNPLGGLTEEDIKGGKDYISVMEENLAVLKKALGE